MSQVVLDSGIFIASVYPEILTAEAKGLLHQLQAAQVTLHAPTLLRYELIAVSRKAIYQGRITAEEGLIARDQLLSYPVTLHFDDALLKRGYELADEYNRPTAYDAQYLALAERLSCDFWTADERMFNAVNSKFAGIRWLGTWNSTK
ncbi:MAG: type II toxin-antitoxin system VapC family toxin [Chloroflexota bacterium]